MFYWHWKKIALALTGFFWAGCGDSTSDYDSSFDKKENVGMSVEDSVGMVVALYGVPADFKSITLCFNGIAKNEAGKEFKIIDCTDGNRYLRDPSDATGEGGCSQKVWMPWLLRRVPTRPRTASRPRKFA